MTNVFTREQSEFSLNSNTKPSRSGRVVYSVVLAVCGTDCHWFEPQTSTSACRHICRFVDQNGSAAMLTSIESTGVTPEVNLRITQVRKYAKTSQTSPEVQNRGLSGPQKGLMSSKKIQIPCQNIWFNQHNLFNLTNLFLTTDICFPDSTIVIENNVGINKTVWNL